MIERVYYFYHLVLNILEYVKAKKFLRIKKWSFKLSRLKVSTL